MERALHVPAVVVFAGALTLNLVLALEEPARAPDPVARASTSPRLMAASGVVPDADSALEPVLASQSDDTQSHEPAVVVTPPVPTTVASVATAPPASEPPLAELESLDELSSGEPWSSPRCETDLRLEAALHDPRQPERSMALMRGRAHAGSLYRLGAHVRGFRVVSIAPDAVLLERDARTCRIGMFTVGAREKIALEGKAPKHKRGARAQRARARAEKTGPALSASELAAGIRVLGKGRYQVDRALLTRAMSELPALAKGTSLRPVRRRGAVVGMRLARLPKEGVLSSLGLRKGDVLRTINGYALGTADGLLNARTQLGRTDRMTLIFERRGRNHDFEYQLR